MEISVFVEAPDALHRGLESRPRDADVEVALLFDISSLPWLGGAERLAEGGHFPGGAGDNKRHFGAAVEFEPELAEWRRLLCFSPETSGGLLIALPVERADEAVAAASARGFELRRVGTVTSGQGIRVLGQPGEPR